MGGEFFLNIDVCFSVVKCVWEIFGLVKDIWFWFGYIFEELFLEMFDKFELFYLIDILVDGCFELVKCNLNL